MHCVARPYLLSIIVSVWALAASATTPIEGLVARYQFAGNTDDTSGNGNHGTASGPVLTSDRFGTPNEAYEFDGSNDLISVPSATSLNLTQALSLTAWVFPTEQKTQVVVRKGAVVNGSLSAPYALALDATGRIGFSVRVNGVWSQIHVPSYPLAVWTFVAGTWDGTTSRIYMNGVPVSAVDFPGVLNQNNTPLLIGTRLQLPADTFRGALDDIAIYNRALTASEVMNMYTLPPVSVEPASWSGIKASYR